MSTTPIIERDWIFFQANDTTAKTLDAVYVKSKNAWKVPNTLGALRELHRHGYNVAEYGKKKAEIRKSFLALKQGENSGLSLSSSLRPYQRIDVSFLAELPHAAIFNEQRTGKTPTTLKLIEAEGHEKIIVICPASLVLNWKKEVETWTAYSASAVSGTKKKRENIYQSWTEGFLIVSKDTAKADVDLLEKFTPGAAVIVDEAHFLRNYRTAQSKAIYKLSRKASKRLALTGTPAVNKGDDLYGILHFLYPEKFPSYWQFVERYFKVWETPWGAKQVSSYKRKEELQEILDLISVQRKRSEVMQWVPAKQYQRIEVEMDAKQKRVYEDMLNTFVVQQDDEVIADAPSVLAQLTRLRQISLHPDLLDIKAPSAKESFILEWLEDNPNEQVIIFSNFSSYLKKLFIKLDDKDLKPGMIIGETSKKERFEIVEDFQGGARKIILANIEAAGTGLTLDKAGTVIFLDRHYTPAANVQAEDRIVPTTEASNLNALIIDVVCKDSTDEKILDILSKKKSVIEVVNNYRNIRELINGD